MGWAVATEADALRNCLGSRRWPRIIDVRRGNAFELAPSILPTATWHDHRAAAEWGAAYLAEPRVVVYCAHGEELSQGTAAVLRSAGVNAAFLKGGFSAWHALNAPTIARARLASLGPARPRRWLSATRSSVNQLACPWFIRRFVEASALFHFVAEEQVSAVAQEIGAIPFDVAGGPFPPEAGGAALEAMIGFFSVDDPALQRLAAIVRAADSGGFDQAPEAAGVAALAAGLAADIADDPERMDVTFALFDALYLWARKGEARRLDASAAVQSQAAKS